MADDHHPGEAAQSGQPLGQSREVLIYDQHVWRFEFHADQQFDDGSALRDRGEPGLIIHPGQQHVLPRVPDAADHHRQRHVCPQEVRLPFRTLCGVRGSKGAVPHPADVAETLNISSAQAYALVRSGDLRAIKVGGRGQWRVEATELEAYIERAYQQTAQSLDAAKHSSDLR